MSNIKIGNYLKDYLGNVVQIVGISQSRVYYKCIISGGDGADFPTSGERGYQLYNVVKKGIAQNTIKFISKLEVMLNE